MIKDEKPCPNLIRLKDKTVNLETPRIDKKEGRKDERLKVEMRTPSPKKYIEISKKEAYDDLQDTDETDGRYLDNF